MSDESFIAPPITVLEELRIYIDPLTPDEYDALERSILAEGCRDALVLWGEVLVDGHNRYSICSKHGLPFRTMQHSRFRSLEDVHLWMIDQHLGRRSVSDYQRGVLALRKKAILAARLEAAKAAEAPSPAPVEPVADATPASHGEPQVASDDATKAEADALASREALARAARLSAATVSHIEKIQKQAAPELVEAVKQGTISISAAATVASLPVEEQQAAVAGGKKELQQAARQVREQRKQTRAAESPATDSAEDTPPWEATDGLEDGPRPGETPEETIARLLQTVRALREAQVKLQAKLVEMGG